MLTNTAAAASAALTTLACNPASRVLQQRAFRAEQDHLLVRLAADSGARRGELAVLRHTDLEGRVLTIERGLSAGALGSTKSSRSSRLTLGATTTELINQHSALWRLQQTSLADWLFPATPARATHLTADALSHRFARLGRAAGVDHLCLHRLRHGLATYLVNEGNLLKALARPPRPRDHPAALEPRRTTRRSRYRQQPRSTIERGR